MSLRHRGWARRLPRLRRLRRSLGLRLLTLFLLLALATAGIFLYGMQRALAGGWIELLRPLVADYVDRLAADIGSPPDLARARALAERLPIAIRIDGPQVNFDSRPARPGARNVADGGSEVGGASLHDSLHDIAHDGWRDNAWLLTRHTADGHRIRFGLGDPGWQQRPRNIGWLTLAALLLLTLVAYAYVRRLFRPLDDIRAGALRYGRGDFARPIPLRRRDELGELARQVNTMASELHRMLDAKRALLLAISHELRSPLTRARLHAELLAGEGADEADDPHREALLRDLAEMRELIAGLLESERLAGGHAALHCENADLGALLRETIDESFGAAGLQPQIEAALPPLPIDRTRMRLLLRNLIDNALRHSAGAEEPPEISLRRAPGGDALELKVRDFGPGVAADHLPHLTEPFYRADAARQRATGGVGLGLTLCALVAQAHGGRLNLRNAEPGFEAALRLPLTPPAD